MDSASSIITWIASTSSEVCSGTEPIDGEQYLWPKDILNQLQDYAFTKGFAIMILSGSEKKGRMRFDCIHHGKARDTRKIDHHDSDTPTGIYSQVEII